MATIALPRLLPTARRPSAAMSTRATTVLSLDILNAPSVPPPAVTTPTPTSSPSTPGLPAEPIVGQCPSPVPNKHIPVCPTGPAPRDEPNTPPPSPAAAAAAAEDQCPRSLLFPPDRFARLGSDSDSDSDPDLDSSSCPCMYAISAADLAHALDFIARQPLPDPSRVFPWLHGLHPHNHIQQAFFVSRRRALRKTPPCLRGITVVKADGDLGSSRLKGAVAPSELLLPGPVADFLDIDPSDGFSIRNFQIQAAKAAMTSDIVVYGPAPDAVRALGWTMVHAQRRWRAKQTAQAHDVPVYNTFVCLSPFSDFERDHADLVAVDAAGRPTGNVIDFFLQERREMDGMTRASEISHNVWLGPSPDLATDDDQTYDVLIECSDGCRLDPAALRAVAVGPAAPHAAPRHPTHVEFPSSGSIQTSSWSHAEADAILETCKWIWHLAHGTRPAAAARPGHPAMAHDAAEAPAGTQAKPLKILIHCADGYTESTLLGIAYYSYSTAQPVPAAWLHLHTDMKRNFFAYPTDVALLTALAPRLLHESPARARASLAEITVLVRDEPAWLAGLDGSFPSRLTDYMYLGNLGHANNPDLLRALGIGQILSVGETAMWRDGELEDWGVDNACNVQGVQDNGIDSLTHEFDRCLEFIGE